MPESPQQKIRQAPPPPSLSAPAAEAYAELDVTSNFSFLRGSSHPDELVFRAAELGYRAIAITDWNTLAGVVRAHDAARQVVEQGGTPPKLVIGSRLSFIDGPDLLVYPMDRAAYGRLCRLLTLGKRRAEKGECQLTMEDFLEHSEGMLAAIIVEYRDAARQEPRPPDAREGEAPAEPLRRLREMLGNRLSLAASCLYGTDDESHLRQLLDLSRTHRIPLMATNTVHYHDPQRRALQDILTCIRHGCTIQEAGFRLFANGERYLKTPRQMHRLFREHPHALRRALEVAEQCAFNLDTLKYEYPDEVVPAGQRPIEYLAQLARNGASERYNGQVPDKVHQLIEHELKLIEELKFEAYFLTVYDLVQFARSRGILCQGRGSAANSAVCYCIGVTSVDPARIDLLFERFVSAARNEPPDIDIDFEHERREEVLQYIYEKYGRERAGMTAEVISYRGRSAIRDVGKALGLSLDLVDSMAKRLDGWERGTLSEQQLREVGLDPSDRTVRLVVELTGQILGFPRHLSQHVGGMVMTRGPLCEMVPIENASMEGRTVIEWDKDDIDTLGILKVDCLGLGMLTCISKALRFVNEANEAAEQRQTLAHGASRGGINVRDPSPGGAKEMVLRPSGAGTPSSSDTQGLRPGLLSCAAPRLYGRNAPATNEHDQSSDLTTSQPVGSASADRLCGGFNRLELWNIPAEDPAVYAMISNADTVGVFQVESRAQMSMLPRLRPKCFYDLVIEVAIVRPGPIQGNMVHPYLRRRNGLEQVVYPSEALRRVLERTLGVPLFQEQAMRVAMVGAGFTAAEADQLRRAMAAWRKSGAIEKFHSKIIDGMLRNGYTREFAEQCFLQIRGFGEYGFPESHSASFALLVYASAWLKRYHPAAFCAALLNSQPMGFYAPAQIVRDARDHGVEVRAVDVNFSQWDCTLEERHEGTEDLRSAARRHEGKANWGLDGPAVRLGFRQIKGMREEDGQAIAEIRQRSGGFTSIEQFHRATVLRVATLRRLAEADAFGSLDLSRRQAFWEAMQLKDDELPLFDLPPSCLRASLPSCLPLMPLAQEVMTDYRKTGLSLKQHPLALVRDQLLAMKIVRAIDLQPLPQGRWVKVAGLVLIRQRPGTAGGILFETLEDETGIVNLIVRPEVYARYRAVARHAALLAADGYIERQGQVMHVLVKRLHDLSGLIRGYELNSRDFH